MTRTIHVCLSVRGALMSWTNRDFVNLIKHDDGRTMTTDEAKSALMDELAKGHEVLPFGEPCEGFSYRTGCPGHDVPEAEA
jgi:hypothetical protein